MVEPGHEFEAGAANPGAGLLLKVHPSAVAQVFVFVFTASVDEETGIFFTVPRLKLDDIEAEICGIRFS